MKIKTFRLLAMLLAVALTVCSVPVVTVTADALTVSVDSINGNKGVSGCYIWTTGTFDATYWIAIEASYVSYNVYQVEAIYPSGSKNVTVSGNDILLVAHSGHAQYGNVSKIGLGDVLTLYNINLNTGACNSGYVRVSSATGLTISMSSSLEVDRTAKTISNISVGSTVGALKTHICEASDEIVVKDLQGNSLNDQAFLGTGYTVKTAKSQSYTLYISGDMDGNAKINSTDYLVISTGIGDGSVSVSSAEGDVNGDGIVNTADVIIFKNEVAGVSGSMLPPLESLTKKEPEEVVVPESTLNYHSVTCKFPDVSGTHNGTVISNGKLTLASGSTSGTFTTNTFNVGTFTNMLASWNAVTNGGKVSMAVSFEVSGGAWSKFLSWGTWSSSSGVTASGYNSDTYGEVDIDILTVFSGYTPTGNIKVRLTLTKYNNGVPVVDNFSVATPQMSKRMTVNTSVLPTTYLNDVPMRSQLASENGSIGNIICSPTSTAMALEYMGTKVTSLTAARAVYDNDWGAYGNWSFAAAYAGEKGYVAYIDYYDTNMMKYALSQGCVIGCATSLTSSGHIVLVVGYTVINGVEYFIVNDPNVSGTNPKRTNYTVSYFESTWIKASRNNFGVVYVFQGVHDLNDR